MVKNRSADSSSQQNPHDERRGGFTLVEVIIAIVILAFGLMGMAGTTALVVRQISLSDLATERSAVVQTTLERLRALPFDSVSTGSDSVGIFFSEWTVTTFENQWKVVNVTTTGPGIRFGSGFPMLSASVSNTFEYRIIRP